MLCFLNPFNISGVCQYWSLEYLCACYPGPSPLAGVGCCTHPTLQVRNKFQKSIYTSTRQYYDQKLFQPTSQPHPNMCLSSCPPTCSDDTGCHRDPCPLTWGLC